MLVRSNVEPIVSRRKEEYTLLFSSTSRIKPMPIKTLIRGKDILTPLHPVEGLQEFDTKNVKLKPILIQNLSVHQLNSLQRCVWPHVRHGRNCTIVGGTNEKSTKGKTLSYLVPMASTAIDNEAQLKAGLKIAPELQAYRSKESGGDFVRKGPIGLIICASYNSADKIRRQLEDLLRGTTLEVYATIGTEDEGRLRANLRKNPEFLIVKADVALRLWDTCFYEYFRFERIRFLVFDDFHILCETRYYEVQELIQRAQHHIHRAKLDSNVQIIYCGQEWNDKIACATVKTSVDNILFIGAPMEALRYSGIDVKVHFVHPDDKIQAFGELFDQSMIGARTIVFCKDEGSVALIGTKLRRSKQIKALLATKRSSDTLSDFKNIWKTAGPKDNVVIVTLDSVYKELEIDNALNVIHFDLPPSFRQEAFGERYMTMWSNFPDITTYETKEDDALDLKPEIDLTSHVFITAEDTEMHKVVRKLHTMNYDIPETLIRLTEQQMIHATKSILNLCSKMLALGKCSSSSCKSRHIFIASDFEQEPNIPLTGRVEVRIVDVLDVNVYNVKVLSYYDVDPKTNKMSNYKSYFHMERSIENKLQAYFSDASKLEKHSKPEVGTDCIIKYSPKNEADAAEVFVRGKIDKTLSSDNPLEKTVRVFCVDTGVYVWHSPHDIYVLPEQFKLNVLKTVYVTLILANLKPLADEPNFPKPLIPRMKEFVENKIYTGKVVLSIGDTVWTLPLVEHAQKSDGKVYQLLNVRHELIKNMNSALDNPAHLKTLYKMCEEAGFNSSIYDPPVVLGEDFESTHFSKGNQTRSDQSTVRAFVGSLTSDMKNDSFYNMNHRRRGKAVIFNFDRWDNTTIHDLGLNPRQGSAKDRDDLTRSLQLLHFEVESYDNCAHLEMWEILTKLRNEDHKDADCLVVVFLSHGERNTIYMRDGTQIPVNLIWESFEAHLCPTLAGKPKIFIIQACRGRKYDGGTEMSGSNPNLIPGSVSDETDSGTLSYVIPNAADIIVAFSCPLGHYSWRCPEKGSWFIQSICTVFDEYAYQLDLQTLFTTVAREVALNFVSNTTEWESDKKKQVTSTSSTLIRTVRFKPKHTKKT